ncbi:MAG TPA: hypothetical protein VN829_14425 [Dongiaceae bacterium]|nr:hypothetical protein [Dongiaceae bacterium]
MTDKETGPRPAASVQEVQPGWHALTLEVAQLHAELKAVAQENKSLRSLLERVIDHRQKSHTELVLILTNLVGKLPFNDVGVIVSKLVEHNTHATQFRGAPVNHAGDAVLSQPDLLKTLDQKKRDLAAALRPAVEELVRLDPPLERPMLESFLTQPDLFFSPRAVRANRCFVKGYVPRERIVREFGEEALVFFNDLTTDPKLNPRPKPEEIVLGFKDDFEALLERNPGVAAARRQELLALHQRVQRSKGATEHARAQRNAFQRISFLIELLHFYEHSDTEAPDVLFAQRLPGLIEQLALCGFQDRLDEKLIVSAEALLALVVNPDHRLMVINNLGKGGGLAKTLKFILRLRGAKAGEPELDQVIGELIRHLTPTRKAPPPAALAGLLRLVNPGLQHLVVRLVMGSERLRKEEAEALGKAVAAELGLKLAAAEGHKGDPLENERQRAWARIKDLVARRGDATTIAAAIRDRLNAKFDADEIRQSWLALIEADSIGFIRIFCQIPYRADGATDAMALPVIGTYVSRLTHEKYAPTYHRLVNSLRSMFQAKPDNPTLLTFMALVRWANPEAANKLCADVGMPVPATARP